MLFSLEPLSVVCTSIETEFNHIELMLVLRIRDQIELESSTRTRELLTFLLHRVYLKVQ